jgi:hypothetical protein
VAAVLIALPRLRRAPPAAPAVDEFETPESAPPETVEYGAEP